MQTFNRDEIAAWARLTRPQLDHLWKLGVVKSDVGNVRKKMSLLEARLAVVAREAMRAIDPVELVEPMDYLRDLVRAPDGYEYTSIELSELQQTIFQRLSNPEIKNPLTVERSQKLHHAVGFDRAFRGKGDFYFQIVADSDGWRTACGDDLKSPDDAISWLTIDVSRLAKKLGDLGRGRDD